jgi:calcineurin-like phosphoesterase family protein
VDYLELTHKGSKLVIFHYPIASWNGMSRGSIHLHAHTHRSPEDKYINGGRSMDVGLDGNNLMPYNLDEVVDDLRKRTVKREGHHS